MKDPVLEDATDEHGPHWRLTLDTDIPHGVITIEPWGYGIGILVNGKYLCAIDLYHRSEESEDDDAHGAVQVVIDPEDGGDGLAFVRRFLDGRTEISVDSPDSKRFEHLSSVFVFNAPEVDYE